MVDLDCLSNCREALKANVIFFHGLGGHPRLTWQSNKLDESTLWPRWLAEDIEGHAIWSVGYESPVSRWRGHAMGLYDRAQSIMGCLIKEPRLGDGRVILIGHSLGGLVIKQFLEILGYEANNSAAAASLLGRIDKVAFLATPHTGADLAIWGDRLRIVVRPSAATMCLVRNDENLRRLNDWYRGWAADIGLSHLVLRETKPIRILGTIVKPDTADPALLGVRAWPTDHDHWSIAKPNGRSDDVYVHVKQFVLDQFKRPKPRIEELAEEILSVQRTANSDTQNIFNLLKRSEQSADISITVSNYTFEIVFPNSDVASLSSDLELQWQSLASAVQPGDYNILDALRWNFGLVEKLYGREEELKKILEWSERTSAPPSARLVTGEGGSGKTRLAAAAAKALQDGGWIAGFLKPGESLRIETSNAKGLFLILDYPEENLDLVRALIKRLAATKRAAYPIRLLLLSRRDFDHWEAETLILEGRFGNQQIAAPGGLSMVDALDLIEEAASKFAQHAGLATPHLAKAPAWASEAPLHRLPLIAAAAAVHAVLAPQEAFGIEGRAIVHDLAKRERVRVQRTSEHLGIGSNALGHFLALGVIGDGLHVEAIEKLVDADICPGASKQQIVQRVSNTPWWRSGRLIRLAPDRIAASFLEAQLFGAEFPDGHTRLSSWLAIALMGAEEGFGNRLGRILFDMDALGAGASKSLERQLARIVEDDPGQAVRFASIASEEVPYAAAGFAATIASTLARLSSGEPEVRAKFLVSQSNYLSILGQREEALVPAAEAVAIIRDLALTRADEFKPSLAKALDGLARVLSGLERREEALAAATEAVNIDRELYRAQPEAFAADLAVSLNTLATMLAGLGDREKALATVNEAVAIWRPIARARADVGIPNLAGALGNLANILSSLGRREEALAAATEASDLYRNLAVARAHSFTPHLARSLGNLANMLSEFGRREKALAAAVEAASLFRDLAQARPETFMPDLALSLATLANRLSEVGRHEEALSAINESASLYRDLARGRPEVFAEKLAMCFHNEANMLSELGRHEEALIAARKSADHCRDLARRWPDAFIPRLAMSLNNLASRLSELGRYDEALPIITEVVEHRRNLALASTEAFAPNLANSLMNQARAFSGLDRHEEALAALTEAVAIFRDLASAMPEAFIAALARSLSNLAGILTELGRPEEALTVALEAVAIRRDLARRLPDAFKLNLANSLDNLAGVLSMLDRHDDAMVAKQEAANLRQRK